MTMIIKCWGSPRYRLTLIGQDGDAKTTLRPAESFGAHNLQQITPKMSKRLGQGFKGFAQTKQSVTDRIKNVKLGFKDLEQAKQS